MPFPVCIGCTIRSCNDRFTELTEACLLGCAGQGNERRGSPCLAPVPVVRSFKSISQNTPSRLSPLTHTLLQSPPPPKPAVPLSTPHFSCLAGKHRRGYLPVYNPNHQKKRFPVRLVHWCSLVDPPHPGSLHSCYTLPHRPAKMSTNGGGDPLAQAAGATPDKSPSRRYVPAVCCACL